MGGQNPVWDPLQCKRRLASLINKVLWCWAECSALTLVLVLNICILVLHMDCGFLRLLCRMLF